MAWTRAYKKCMKKAMKGKGKIGPRIKRAAKKCRRYRKKK